MNDYTCLSCGHLFPLYAHEEGEGALCPRCGSHNLERNPWLLGTPGSHGLSQEDYFDAGLHV